LYLKRRFGKLSEKIPFRWSFSRHRQFKICKRQYFYENYPERCQKIMLASQRYKDALSFSLITYPESPEVTRKIKRIEHWIGEVVHKTIEHVIDTFLSDEIWLSEENAIDFALRLTTEEWKASLNHKNLDKEKMTGPILFEHYYNQPSEKFSDLEKAKKTVKTCIKQYFIFLTKHNIKRLQKSCLLRIKNEQDSLFSLEGIPISVKIDFGIDDKKSKKICIYDFKTGKKSNNHKDQFLFYALWAIHKMNKSRENISGGPVYLYPKYEYHPITLSEVQLRNLKEEIAALYKEAESLHEALANTEFPKNLFPKTNKTKLCFNCRFQKLCNNSFSKEP